MKVTSVNLALSLIIVFAVQGCSGPHQDPRISLCRNLSASLTQTADADLWTSAGEEFVRPEFARVKVKTESGASASCYYEYDAVEENALTQSDPLSAYSTLPYKMILNGTPVTAQSLKTAVMAEQTKTGKKVAKKIQEGIENVKDDAEKAINNL